MQRYRAFRDEIRRHMVTIPQPFHHVLFVLPMPRTWPALKRSAMVGMPHRQKPDRDNLEKALLDSVYDDDAHIWDGRTTKVWGPEPLVVVSAAQLFPPGASVDLHALYWLADQPQTLYAPRVA